MSTLETPPSRETQVDGPTPSRDIARMLGLAVALALLACLALLAVIVPGQNSMPRDVPIGLAGPEATVSQLRELLTTAQPGAYDVQTFDDGESMRAAAEGREIYGGFVVDEVSPGVVIATGASPALASFLTSFGGQLGLTNVSDVAQTTAADPTATGILVAVVVASVLSLAGAVALSRMMRGRPRAQVVGALVLAVVVGLTVAASLQLLGSVEGAFWTVSGAVALALLAGTLVALGLVALVGLVSGAVAHLVLLVLPGIGLSGLSSAPEMLPSGWGALGQLLPTGAAGSLLQSAAYFGGEGGLRPVLVLVGWGLLGLVLLTVGVLRRRRTDARTLDLEAALAAEADADREEEIEAAGSAEVPDGPVADSTEDLSPEARAGATPDRRATEAGAAEDILAADLADPAPANHGRPWRQ